MKDPGILQGKIISLMVGRDLTQRYPERNVENRRGLPRGNWTSITDQAGRV